MPVDTRLRVKRRAAEQERLQAMTMPSAFDGAWTPASDPVTVHTDEQLDGQTGTWNQFCCWAHPAR